VNSYTPLSFVFHKAILRSPAPKFHHPHPYSLFDRFFFQYCIRSCFGKYLFTYGFVDGIIFLPGDKIDFVRCRGGKLLIDSIALVEGKE